MGMSGSMVQTVVAQGSSLSTQPAAPTMTMASPVVTVAMPVARTLAMPQAMPSAIPIYYHASDPSQPMPMVMAEHVAAATPMAPEHVQTYFPYGVPPGFAPMLVGEMT